jgi:hypothetical protein
LPGKPDPALFLEAVRASAVSRRAHSCWIMLWLAWWMTNFVTTITTPEKLW